MSGPSHKLLDARPRRRGANLWVLLLLYLLTLGLVTEIEAHGEIDEVICEGVTISFVRSSAPDGFRSDGCALPMIPSSASAALYGAALRLWGLRGMEALHRSHPGKSIADIPFRDICEFVARTDFPHGERLFKASCVDEDK